MTVVETLFGEHAGLVYDRPLQLLFGANAVVVLGVALVSPIIAVLTEPFGVPAARVGLLVTAIALPATVLIPVGGVLADVYGRKPMLVGGLVLFGVGGAGVGLTTDFDVALGLRLLQGVGMSATFPAIVTSLRDMYATAEESTAQGLRVGVSGASQAVFTSVAGFLVVLAWQYPFAIYALALPVAVGVYLRFEEPTAADLPAGPSDGGVTDDTVGASLRGVVVYVGRPGASAVLFAHTLGFFALFTFLTYNSLVVVEVIGARPQDAGLIAALFSVTYAGTATQVGRLTGWVGGRTALLLAANACIAVGLSAFAFASDLLLGGIGVAVLAAGVGVVAPTYRSLITGFAPERLRAGMVSVGESLGWVAVASTPVLLGLSIGTLEPSAGTSAAVAWTVAAAGVLSGVGGFLCVVVAARSPSVRTAGVGGIDE